MAGRYNAEERFRRLCDLVAVLVVRGLWEPHTRAGGRLVEGRLTLAGRLPRLCRHQDVVGVAEGGK